MSLIENDRALVSAMETAMRKRATWESTRGSLSLQDLYGVPLRSKDGFNLNDIATRCAARVKEAESTINFVDANSNKPAALIEAELKFDLVRHVIATLLADEQEAERRASNKKELSRLLEIKEKRESEQLLGISDAELDKRIKKLM